MAKERMIKLTEKTLSMLERDQGEITANMVLALVAAARERKAYAAESRKLRGLLEAADIARDDALQAEAELRVRLGEAEATIRQLDERIRELSAVEVTTSSHSMRSGTVCACDGCGGLKP